MVVKKDVLLKRANIKKIIRKQVIKSSLLLLYLSIWIDIKPIVLVSSIVPQSTVYLESK